MNEIDKLSDEANTWRNIQYEAMQSATGLHNLIRLLRADERKARKCGISIRYLEEAMNHIYEVHAAAKAETREARRRYISAHLEGTYGDIKSRTKK